MLSTFRIIAIGLPNVTEGSDSGGADFRVGGQVFAALDDRDETAGIVHLSRDAQARFCAADPAMFAPATSLGNSRSATRVQLQAIDEETLRSALRAAWQHVSAGATTRQRRAPGTPEWRRFRRP